MHICIMKENNNSAVSALIKWLEKNVRVQIFRWIYLDFRSHTGAYSLILLILKEILYIFMILSLPLFTSKNVSKILGTVLCNSMPRVSLCNSGV